MRTQDFIHQEIPKIIEIVPRARPFLGVIDLPGSKSIINRVVLLAALADGKSVFRNFLCSDDTEAMLEGLKALGVKIEINKSSKEVLVTGCNGQFPNSNAEIFMRDSGTMTRFLLPVLAAQKRGRFRVSASERMSQRPIKECLKAIEALGGKITYQVQDYSMPLIIEAQGLNGGGITVSVKESTQFLSGLLMAGALCKGPLILEQSESDGGARKIQELNQQFSQLNADKSYNESYVKMSVNIIHRFGGAVKVTSEQPLLPRETNFSKQSEREIREGLPNQISEMKTSNLQFSCFPRQYKNLGKNPEDVFYIEPDLSTASYFFAAAAITHGEVEVLNIPQNPLQGDISFLHILEQMGCEVIKKANSVVVRGPKENQKLKGIFINMRHFSDTFMTLAAIASFADSPTEIRGIAHTRLQESDRIHAMAEGLKILGGKVEVFEDGLKIYPQNLDKLHGAVVSSFNDHRIAMSLALVGLRVPGVKISGFECVKKTCPDYFQRINS